MKRSDIKKGLLLLAGATFMYSCTQDPANPDDGKDGNGTTPEEPKEIVLTDFTPTEAKAGAQVTLSGENFGTVKTDVSVWFGEVQVEENYIANVRDNAIVVTVPNLGAEKETVDIKVQVGKGEAKTYETKFSYLVDEPQYETVWEVETFAGSGVEAPMNSAPQNGSALEATFRRISTIAYDPVANVMYTGENSDAPKGLRRIVKDGTGAYKVEEVVADLSVTFPGFNPKSICLSKDQTTLYVASDNGDGGNQAPAVIALTRGADNLFENPQVFLSYSEHKIANNVQCVEINPVSGAMVLYSNAGSKLYHVNTDTKTVTEVGEFASFADRTEGSVRFSPDGTTLYIIPSGYHGILKANWDLTNNTLDEITKFVGGNGRDYADGGPDEAKFNTPFHLCFAPDGNGMYVADRDNHRIRFVTLDGQVSTYTGGSKGFKNGTLEESQFCRPCTVTFGENGLLYIGEYRDGTANLGNRVRVIKSRQVQID